MEALVYRWAGRNAAKDRALPDIQFRPTLIGSPMQFARRGRLALLAADGGRLPTAIPLCGLPWRQPWKPARDVSQKGLILDTKCPLESRLFVRHHKDMTSEPEQRTV
jgi:hypothetical protein